MYNGNEQDMKIESFGMNVKILMHERLVDPTVLYGADSTWCLNARDKRRLNMMEIKCLRRICWVTIRDRIMNEENRKRVGVLIDISGRVEKCVLRWFGHVEHMDGKKDL